MKGTQVDDVKHVPTIDKLLELPEPGDVRISEMAVRVAGQRAEQGHRSIVVYTAPAQEDPTALISFGFAGSGWHSR